MRPYILAETNFKALRETRFDLALLPWGATEAHNFHLPYGTDNFETDAFAAEAARIAWESGARCLVLPSIPFGVNTGQEGIAGTINIYPSTQSVILNDILESVSNSGITKVMILNGHGGNDFKQMLREAGSNFPELFLLTANWYQSVDKSDFFKNEGDHADEMETSLMMHLKPELVRPLNEAGSGDHLNFVVSGLNEKWTWSERKWVKVSKDSGIGNPAASSSTKGISYFEAVCNKIAQLIIEIGKMDQENPYS